MHALLDGTAGTITWGLNGVMNARPTFTDILQDDFRFYVRVAPGQFATVVGENLEEGAPIVPRGSSPPRTYFVPSVRAQVSQGTLEAVGFGVSHGAGSEAISAGMCRYSVKVQASQNAAPLSSDPWRCVVVFVLFLFVFL